jgi:hypothetical protein
MALNRHFCRHFARFVRGISAISAGGLSPGENDPGLLGETAAGTRRRERAVPAPAFCAGTGRLNLTTLRHRGLNIPPEKRFVIMAALIRAGCRSPDVQAL